MHKICPVLDILWKEPQLGECQLYFGFTVEEVLETVE
jgi:hypothetical protein